MKLLHFGYAFEPEWRAVRDLARKRLQLVRTRTTHILALETIFARQTGAHLSGKMAKALDVEDVARWGWADDVTLAAQVNVLAVQAMERGIAIIERRLHERVKLAPEYAVLKSVPGIREILSTVIMLETGPIERFTSAGNYASYARCVGSGRFSNSKKKGQGNRKNGNTYLAWAFVEAAHYAMRYNDAAKRFYERKRTRSNTALATKALAHKLARACYHMLKGQMVFDEKRCFA